MRGWVRLLMGGRRARGRRIGMLRCSLHSVHGQAASVWPASPADAGSVLGTEHGSDACL